MIGQLELPQSMTRLIEVDRPCHRQFDAQVRDKEVVHHV